MQAQALAREQPLSFGSWSSVPKGLPPIKSTEDTYDTGPTVYKWRPVPGPFRPVRLGPDESKSIWFVFHANPKSICGTAVYSVDAVIVHFTTFSVVHDTQTLPLGDAAFSITHRC